MRELSQNMISFNRYGDNINLNKSEIMYCNSDSYYTHIALKNGKVIDIPISLQKVLDKINSHEFIRIHKEQIINMNYISKHKKGIIHKIILENGNELTLGRAFKKDFINNYLEFLKIKELKDYV